MNITDRNILQIALPSIVSNITVPLLGLADVAIVGHIGGAQHIGAIAVGSMIFNVIYWIFGFLRMGTSGMTAQAYGAADRDETARLLLRSLAVALSVAVVILVLQRPLLRMALLVISPTPDIVPMVRTYFSICVYGAPAMLGLYGMTGWYIGMQNTRIPMLVSILQNVVNIAASLVLVFGAGMQVEGIALGTLIAQYAGFGMAVALFFRRYRSVWQRSLPAGLFVRRAMMLFFSVNRDIFLRTLYLVAVNLYFLSAGAAMGAETLAVNTLLMQFFTLFSYVMDGFAYAGEALCGRHTGACDERQLHLTVRHLFVWGAILTVVYTLLYAVGGDIFLSLLTDDGSVTAAAQPFFAWVLAIPVAGVAAFIWDGVFIGMTATRSMLLATAVAAAAFFLVYTTLAARWGNHALWLALLIYLFVRGLVQSLLWTSGRVTARKGR